MIDLPVVLDDPRQKPARATEWSAGLDLHAAEDIVLPVGGRRLVPTGVKASIPEGHVGLLASRSGWGLKYGITLANSLGVIDADFRGEIGAVLINHGDKSIAVSRGDRIAQLLVLPVALPQVRVVEDLDDTARGAGGFGSTGTAAQH